MFLFASELKALQASGLLSREISPAGLVGYLMFGSVPNPWGHSSAAGWTPARW
jgi:predicted DNA-binding transcriptional regulator